MDLQTLVNCPCVATGHVYFVGSTLIMSKYIVRFLKQYHLFFYYQEIDLVLDTPTISTKYKLFTHINGEYLSQFPFDLHPLS